MTQFSKIFIFLLLALLLPAIATAYDFEVDGIYYNINGSEATVTWGNNSYSGDVTIPETITYSGITYTVTSIGSYVFRDCNGLISVNIPNSVTSIGGGAFEGCRELTSVNLPNAITTINENTFHGCNKLSNINIPNTVTSIGDYAFWKCSSLIRVNIPDLVNYIGWGAFSGCEGLNSINIPASTHLGIEAFCGCSGLTSISVASDNPYYDSRNDCNAIIETATNTLILGCMNTIIPNSVTSIDNNAFYCCSGLTSINIPESVIEIRDGAFYGCTGLTNVIIPNSITHICSMVFYDCSGLTSATIGNAVTSIDSNAFHGCSNLKSITIPNAVNYIAHGAFAYCSDLTNIVVASDNPKYDSRNNCNAIVETANNTLIVGCMNTLIPNSVTSIGEAAFEGCTKLTSINIPNSVIEIGEWAFWYCTGLTSVYIGNSVTSIGYVAFKGCTGLTSINIPNSVIEIDYSAFENCTSLTHVNIGNSVSSIGDKAFFGCTKLTRVTCLATTPPSCYSSNYSSSFPYDITNQATLYVPWNSLSTYQTAKNWKEFNRIVGILGIDDFEVDGIYYHALSENTTMVIQNPEEECYYQGDVVIPDSVSYQDFTFTVIGIDANAFDGCDELNSVVIGNAVETIEEEAFQGCTGLTSVTIGSSLTNIGERAFNYCNSLQTVKCLGTVPPAMASSNCFSSAAYRKATLKVPRNYAEDYTATDYWYKFEDIEGYGSAGLGDVNGDGEINITDVTVIIDRLLHANADGEFYIESADLNNNGHLDIADVITLIDMLITSGN